MARQNPIKWLSYRTATGLKDLPSNTAWAVSKVLVPAPVEKAAGGVKDTARGVSASIKDTVPGTDSLDTKLKRAREATERAQAAEHKALSEASEAKRLADEHKAQVEQTRVQIRQAKAEAAETVKQRVAEVRAKADAMVEEERAKAQADADKSVAKVSDEANSRVEKSRAHADEAQEQAQVAIGDATEQMAAARRLADEAAQEAQAAAAEAQRRAEELAGEARRHAAASTNGVAEAEKVQREAAGTAADVAVELRKPEVSGDLKSMTKNELTELAVALGVERRTGMNKQQLVSAINRESKKSR